MSKRPKYFLYNPETGHVVIYETMPVGEEDVTIGAIHKDTKDFNEQCENLGVIPAYVKHVISFFTSEIK